MSARFWYLDPPVMKGLAERAPDTEFETVVCPVDEGHRRAGTRLSALSAIVDPSRAGDFVWLWGGEILVSQAILDLFEEYRATGFEAKRAKISYSRPSKARMPDLYELVVTGWGGFAAPAAKVRLLESCPGCGSKKYSIAEPSRLIDPKQWDGSDLFIVWPLPGYPFASDRLANILRQKKVSGVKVFPSIAIPVKKGATLSPGSLANNTSMERAREIEQRYGFPID
jgi:hypothetical protein